MRRRCQEIVLRVEFFDHGLVDRWLVALVAGVQWILHLGYISKIQNAKKIRVSKDQVHEKAPHAKQQASSAFPSAVPAVLGAFLSFESLISITDTLRMSVTCRAAFADATEDAPGRARGTTDRDLRVEESGASPGAFGWVIRQESERKGPKEGILTRKFISLQESPTVA